MADLLERLGDAMRVANRGWPAISRDAWVREDLLPALGSRMIAVIDVAELAALRAERDAWRSKCHVDAEQVAAVDIDVAMFEFWRKVADTTAAEQIAESLEFARRRNGPDWMPSATWWAFQINRETETTADAQRLLDEIIACA